MRRANPILVLILLIFAFLYVRPVNSQHTTHRHLEQTQDLVHYESLEDWLGKASWLKDQIRISNGLWPAPEKTDLHPKYTAASSFDGYSVQGVTLETMPGFFLNGTLFKPEGEGPFPAVLSAHGHWSTGRFEHTSLASIPGRAIHLAKQGFVVFSYSMIGYNESQDLFPHRFDDPTQQLWGFSSAGLQTWNSLRALDFIAALPFVSPDQMGMTGASGGATQTFILTAIDDRIRVAVPVNMISAHYQGGCICENAPALRLNTNNIEIGALAAPRPLLMVSTSGDWTTNTPAVEYPAIQEIYSLFKAEDHVKNVHLDFPHNYNADSRQPMYAWFNKWLAGKEASSPEGELSIPDIKHLRAPLPEEILSVDELFDAYRQAEVQRLLDTKPVSWSTLQTYRERYETPLRHVLNAEEGSVMPLLEIFPPAHRIEATDAQLIVHGNHPQDEERAKELALELSGRGIFAALVNPFAQVPDVSAPDSIDYWTTYNPTQATRRIQVIRAAAQELVRRNDINHLDLHGIGHAGPLTLLARSQLSAIRHTHADFSGKSFDTDEAFLEELYIPLLRKAGDFHTATALIFPASLTLENLPSGSLKSWVSELYAAFNAEEMLTILP